MESVTGALAALFALVCVTGTALAQDTSRLAGTWKLESVIYRLADGAQAGTDWGENPQGILMYDGKGNMAVQISRADRRAFGSDDRRRGTPAEMQAAFESYIAYFGTYDVDWNAGTVTHSLTACTFPNWVGTKQKRFFELDGDRITLRTPPYSLGGETVTGSLVWRRIAP